MMVIGLLGVCLISWLEPDAGKFLWLPALLVLLVPWLGLLILTGLLVFTLRNWRLRSTWNQHSTRKP